MGNDTKTRVFNLLYEYSHLEFFHLIWENNLTSEESQLIYSAHKDEIQKEVSNYDPDLQYALAYFVNKETNNKKRASKFLSYVKEMFGFSEDFDFVIKVFVSRFIYEYEVSFSDLQKYAHNIVSELEGDMFLFYAYDKELKNIEMIADRLKNKFYFLGQSTIVIPILHTTKLPLHSKELKKRVVYLHKLLSIGKKKPEIEFLFYNNPNSFNASPYESQRFPTNFYDVSEDEREQAISNLLEMANLPNTMLVTHNIDSLFKFKEYNFHDFGKQGKFVDFPQAIRLEINLTEDTIKRYKKDYPSFNYYFEHLVALYEESDIASQISALPDSNIKERILEEYGMY